MRRSPERTVTEVFESVVARWPREPAVSYHGTTLSYAQLNERANRAARVLIDRGVGPDSLVAVALPRSAELVVMLLAVLKAGGAYLPLDPGYPLARLSHMVYDAQPVLLLRGEKPLFPVADPPEIDVDGAEFATACEERSGANIGPGELRAPVSPGHIMYVIYTSGSTGTPKGVAVPHRGVADLVATQADRLGVGPGERVLQWASISFDAAFWDLSLALLSGATLVMADAEDLLPGEALRGTLLKHDVTHAVLPPVALSMTDSDDILEGGTIMSTGDACTPALVRKWSPGRRMFNGYGPTEITVGATIGGPIEDAEQVSIGRPWIGGSVYVLDERLKPVPDMVEGELYLAGSGLARGYLNQPGLTATRFVPDPFGPPGSRMYRSGDRGWRDADGQFYFAGRADGQVKVRGFRIELGEIETRLAQHPAVGIAVAVVAGEFGDARIVAFVTARPGQSVDPAELRASLHATVPEYLVPASIVVLDRLPTLVNGKVNRHALRDQASTDPEPVLSDAAAGAGGEVSAESVLRDTVRELLSEPTVDLDGNLFQLGGNSVTAVRLISAIRAKLGVSLPVRAVLKADRLSDLIPILRGESDPAEHDG